MASYRRYTLGSITDVDLIGPVIPELLLVVGIADTLLIQGALDANLPRLVTIISAMRWYSAALVALYWGVTNTSIGVPSAAPASRSPSVSIYPAASRIALACS